MSKKLTTEEFIDKAKKVHGDKYDYSKINYIDTNTKVCIICPKHGEFWQTPHNHLCGSICPICANENRSKMEIMPNNEFIKIADKIHNGKYDYSETKYINSHTKIRIKCPIHGYFETLPGSHLKGCGCPICGKLMSSKNKTFTNEEFIEKAKKVHGDKYDYSNTKYAGSHEKVEIICPKHGSFSQVASAHLSGHGCHKCAVEERAAKKMKDKNEFIDKAKKFHGDKYDYSKSIYNGRNIKTTIICPKHGEFYMTPYRHIIGQGCPKCKYEKLSLAYRMTREEFIKRANCTHHGKYDYSKVEYAKSNKKICIICPKHGEFWQTPDSHIHGEGCPKCSHQVSKAEDEIYNFLKSLKIKNIERNNRNILEGKEIDIYLSDYKIGIEFDGTNWHTEKYGKGKNYHLKKTEDCHKLGIRLIHIFEDEYKRNREAIFHILSHACGKDEHCEKIYSDKTEIHEIESSEAHDFIRRFSILDERPSNNYFGCFYQNKMIAVMTFSRTSENIWKIDNISKDYNYIFCGVYEAMLSYFIKKINPSEILAFGDLRWIDYDKNIFTKLGFKKTKTLPPDFFYVKTGTNERINNLFLKKKLIEKKCDIRNPTILKEEEKKLNLNRIWNCGTIMYKLKIN